MKFVDNIIEKLVERISQNFSEKFLESLVTKLQENFQEELGKSSKKWIFEKHGSVMVIHVPVGKLSQEHAKKYIKKMETFYSGKEKNMIVSTFNSFQYFPETFLGTL
jgi:3-hydroxy-3-methylglutaryl CoA synthase